MAYQEWESRVPAEIRRGSMWGFYGYRKAL